MKALAKVESIFTAAGETFDTSAVSSTLNAPKKRSSTIRPIRSFSVVQCFMYRKQVCGLLLRDSRCLLQRDLLWISFAFGTVTTTRMVHQNSAHQLSRNAEELRAVFPMGTTLLNEPHVKPHQLERWFAECGLDVHASWADALTVATRHRRVGLACRALPCRRCSRCRAVQLLDGFWTRTRSSVRPLGLGQIGAVLANYTQAN